MNYKLKLKIKNLCKVDSLGHGLKGQNCTPIVRNVARKLLDWVINCKDGENGVGSDKRWFLFRISSRDEDIDAGKVRPASGVGCGRPVEFVMEGCKVGGTIDGVELREYV